MLEKTGEYLRVTRARIGLVTGDHGAVEEEVAWLVDQGVRDLTGARQAGLVLAPELALTRGSPAVAADRAREALAVDNDVRRLSTRWFSRRHIEKLLDLALEAHPQTDRGPIAKP